MDASDKRAFLREHHHGVLVTRRATGGLQTSPIVAGVDDEGAALISVTQGRAKTKNLRRDPRATLTVFTDSFYGPWIQVDGEAELVELPEAMAGLVQLYRQVQGEHPDWADFEAAMHRDGRLLIRIPITG